MDEYDLEEKRQRQNGIAALFMSLVLWLIGGGLITFAPALVHNLDKHAGYAMIYTAWISWLLLPVSILFINIHKYSVTTFLLNTHLVIWLGSVGWLWFAAGF